MAVECRSRVLYNTTPTLYLHNIIRDVHTMMMSTSRFLLTVMVILVSSAAAVVSYCPPHLELQDSHLVKNQLKAQRESGKADDGLAVAYLPAYVIPDGSPVDPCVTCRPRRTTHNCRRNTGDGCPGRSSPTCTTKRCSSSPSPTGSMKRLSSSTSNTRPATASLSSGAEDTTKSSPPASITSVQPDRNEP
ncbi:uncharacterized protein LOC111028465 [Myzus persicae]|uniref:uncharacterized protein LOC111028465 n=1 Tax=Myzus persicae TaxID=13164 RepID=UPI000B932BA7|nr:uncharacterized protein LOC111028465 [Myzus persicae]